MMRRGKKVFVTAEQLEAICRQHETPFYIYDEAGIRESARKLRNAFSWNRGFREYFAVKACANPFILRMLQEEGCGADCSSYTELMLADKMGFRGDDIMFSSNVTPGADFSYARKLEATINLDDITHIDTLAENGGIPECVCLRYNPGGSFSISGAIMGEPGESKYGMTRKQLTEAILRLQQMGVRRFGLHAFLASNMLNPDYYPTLAGILFNLIVELNRETGAVFSFVNLSGGIGIPYRPEEQEADLPYIGEKVRALYEQIIVPSPVKELAIKTELGRYMTGPHGILITRVLHEKKTYKDYIGVDACAVHLIRPAMYGAYHHITVIGKENEPCDQVYDVTGGLCENNDKFAIDRKLPKIEIGDLLAIHDAGAHGYAMGYNYNGRLKCAELLLCEDGSVRMIRRAETPADYFATFDFCDILKD